jgi:hypothetical protein
MGETFMTGVVLGLVPRIYQPLSASVNGTDSVRAAVDPRDKPEDDGVEIWPLLRPCHPGTNASATPLMQ